MRYKSPPAAVEEGTSLDMYFEAQLIKGHGHLLAKNRSRNVSRRATRITLKNFGRRVQQGGLLLPPSRPPTTV